MLVSTRPYIKEQFVWRLYAHPPTRWAENGFWKETERLFLSPNILVDSSVLQLAPRVRVPSRISYCERTNLCPVCRLRKELNNLIYKFRSSRRVVKNAVTTELLAPHRILPCTVSCFYVTSRLRLYFLVEFDSRLQPIRFLIADIFCIFRV